MVLICLKRMNVRVGCNYCRPLAKASAVLRESRMLTGERGSLADRCRGTDSACYGQWRSVEQPLAPLIEALECDLRFAAAGADTRLLLGRFGVIAGRDVHLIDVSRADCARRRTVFDTGRTLFDRSGKGLHDLQLSTLLEYFDWAYARQIIDAGIRARLGPAYG